MTLALEYNVGGISRLPINILLSEPKLQVLKERSKFLCTNYLIAKLYFFF